MEKNKNGHEKSIKAAIEAADPYRGQGTTYLHTTPPFDEIEAKDASNPTGAVVVPISLATTFEQSTPGQPSAKDDPNSFGLGFEYSRTGNPTRGAFERAVAAAEHAKYCVAFSSGSAATSAILHVLKPADNVICVDDVYGGTQRYFRRIVNPSMGITFDFVDFHKETLVKSKLDGTDDHVIADEKKEDSEEDEKGNDVDEEQPSSKKMKREKKTTKTKLLWLETPTNPTLKISNIASISTLSHGYRDCLLVVDNTFCSPYNQTPLDHGADMVVHSVTKYIGGHSDVVMGVVCTNDEELYTKLRFVQNGVGAVPSPFDCFLAHRGLKTLHVRMEAAARNAMAIALFLESHKAVSKVVYPGLKSHPQHELAEKQQHGFGAMITFYCAGSRKQSAIILEQLKVFTLAESLGAVESLAESPSLMTHASVPDEQRALLGIDDTLIRLSVGIESCGDLIRDLDSALNAALASVE
eukprot:CAMPEP_0185723928 /NCGR_PEP_ID=MMETSP1171-20130828/593_1 /TAXON_ID=374046 /ORGANISM="Helicotheca tamensis, Strain CCMP826" /LENGTH=467 /DNA_ID=CAMNT_0028391699 /DNA_START=137 /DNA_END=1540 /DNA_ORIENTATION=+